MAKSNTQKESYVGKVVGFKQNSKTFQGSRETYVSYCPPAQLTAAYDGVGKNVFD